MSNDLDQLQTKEWLDSVDNVIEYDSPERAAYIVKAVTKHLSDKTGIQLHQNMNTEYVNTIPTNKEAIYPGNKDIEKRISDSSPVTNLYLNKAKDEINTPPANDYLKKSQAQRFVASKAF